MATSISICSEALLQLGKKAIASFDDDNDNAVLCSNLYPSERDSILREHFWNCAMKRTVLAPLAEAPPFGFDAQFALPSDFLRLYQVGDFWVGDQRCPGYKLEGRNVLADGTVLPIVYVYRADESVWDSKLVELMTARMLWKLAYPVTQSTSLREELRDEYTRLARTARSIDSSEDSAIELSDDFPLIDGRY